MKVNKNFVHGNYEDKYNSGNLISQFLMANFINKFKNNLNLLCGLKSICEVGTGEGELLKILNSKFPKAKLYGCDLSKEEIDKVKNNCKNIKINLSVQDAQNLKKYKDCQFDLVVCCEVLEHLENSRQGLSELIRISNKYILISVPNEPIWRILNIIRGKYLKELGNTPGHVNHWNIFCFNKFIKQSGLKIVKNNLPFPWQMVLLEKSGIKSQEKQGLLSTFLKQKRYIEVKQYLKINKKMKFLDIGCGEGRLQEFLNIKNNQYIGIDIKKNWHGDKINLFTSDISKGFPKIISTKKFDYILLLALIEHLKKPEDFLIKITKLLKKNGEIIMTTPHPLGRKVHDMGAKIGLFSSDASEEHERFLNKGDFSIICKKNNLKLIKYQRFLFGFNQIIVIKK